MESTPIEGIKPVENNNMIFLRENPTGISIPIIETKINIDVIEDFARIQLDYTLANNLGRKAMFNLIINNKKSFQAEKAEIYRYNHKTENVPIKNGEIKGRSIMKQTMWIGEVEEEMDVDETWKIKFYLIVKLEIDTSNRCILKIPSEIYQICHDKPLNFAKMVNFEDFSIAPWEIKISSVNTSAEILSKKIRFNKKEFTETNINSETFPRKADFYFEIERNLKIEEGNLFPIIYKAEKNEHFLYLYYKAVPSAFKQEEIKSSYLFTIICQTGKEMYRQSELRLLKKTVENLVSKLTELQKEKSIKFKVVFLPEKKEVNNAEEIYKELANLTWKSNNSKADGYTAQISYTQEDADQIERYIIIGPSSPSSTENLIESIEDSIGPESKRRFYYISTTIGRENRELETALESSFKTINGEDELDEKVDEVLNSAFEPFVCKVKLTTSSDLHQYLLYPADGRTQGAISEKHKKNVFGLNESIEILTKFDLEELQNEELKICISGEFSDFSGFVYQTKIEIPSEIDTNFNIANIYEAYSSPQISKFARAMHVGASGHIVDTDGVAEFEFDIYLESELKTKMRFPPSSTMESVIQEALIFLNISRESCRSIKTNNREIVTLTKHLNDMEGLGSTLVFEQYEKPKEMPAHKILFSKLSKEKIFQFDKDILLKFISDIQQYYDYGIQLKNNSKKLFSGTFDVLSTVKDLAYSIFCIYYLTHFCKESTKEYESDLKRIIRVLENSYDYDETFQKNAESLMKFKINIH